MPQTPQRVWDNVGIRSPCNIDTNVLREGAELTGESGKTYLVVHALGQDNAWTAVQKDDHSNLVVLKAPSTTDVGTSWPRFQHEMIMHELLKDCDHVRTQVDRISPVQGAGSPPILALEMMETTLWAARTQRPFTTGEVHAVASFVLLRLAEIHRHGLVFADLKMQNVMLNGFNAAEPSDGSKLVAKLGDLGIVMSPSQGKVQPITYRAPEVYFKGEITQAADIWAFGLVYCHLLEARKRFAKTGMYDDLDVGTGSMPEREQAMRHAIAHDYDIENLDYYRGTPLPYRDERQPVGTQWDELRKRGLEPDQIDFLKRVLVADPRKRPTARAILMSRWFGGDSELELPEFSAQSQDPFVASATEWPEANESSPRHRRDAISAMMPTKSRPEELLRGTSQALFTPAIPSPASTGTEEQSFEKLLQTQSKPVSSIKEHPLMSSALTAPAPDANIGHGSTTSNELSRSVSKDEPDTSPTQDKALPPPTIERSTTQSNVLSSDRPASLAHIGRHSTSGGTWLSYQ